MGAEAVQDIRGPYINQFIANSITKTFCVMQKPAHIAANCLRAWLPTQTVIIMRWRNNNVLIHAVMPGYHVYCDVGVFVVFAHQATNVHNLPVDSI